MNGELSLHTLRGEIIGTENEHRAVVTFWEYVMKEKEREMGTKERDYSGRKVRRLRKCIFRCRESRRVDSSSEEGHAVAFMLTRSCQEAAQYLIDVGSST